MKPILFKTSMVSAIRKGLKTQTRRVKKSKDQKPKYNIGDILYVRETWRPLLADKGNGNELFVRFKDNHLVKFDTPEIRELLMPKISKERWYPSIFLPKLCSRIFLKVTGVVEHNIQDITHEECMAEGISVNEYNYKHWPNSESLSQFYKLWDSINLKLGYGWNSNPEVFAYTFKKITEL